MKNTAKAIHSISGKKLAWGVPLKQAFYYNKDKRKDKLHKQVLTRQRFQLVCMEEKKMYAKAQSISLPTLAIDAKAKQMKSEGVDLVGFMPGNRF